LARLPKFTYQDIGGSHGKGRALACRERSAERRIAYQYDAAQRPSWHFDLANPIEIEVLGTFQSARIADVSQLPELKASRRIAFCAVRSKNSDRASMSVARTNKNKVRSFRSATRPSIRPGRRIYIAGILRNTPDALIAWLRNPQTVVPGNAMPNMGLSESDARDIAAYLYTLR
jgi:hypothetical protein